jgi:hypothetical protein
LPCSEFCLAIDSSDGFGQVRAAFSMYRLFRSGRGVVGRDDGHSRTGDVRTWVATAESYPCSPQQRANKQVCFPFLLLLLLLLLRFGCVGLFIGRLKGGQGV